MKGHSKTRKSSDLDDSLHQDKLWRKGSHSFQLVISSIAHYGLFTMLNDVSNGISKLLVVYGYLI